MSVTYKKEVFYLFVNRPPSLHISQTNLSKILFSKRNFKCDLRTPFFLKFCLRFEFLRKRFRIRGNRKSFTFETDGTGWRREVCLLLSKSEFEQFVYTKRFGIGPFLWPSFPEGA